MFRASLQKNPLKLDFWNPLQTVTQVAKLTTDYGLYDLSVTGNSNDQERKNQLNNLEKTLVLIGEGSEARSEMAAFFTKLKSEKVTYVQALQRIAALHWKLHTNATETVKWFNLSKFNQESGRKHDRGKTADDTKESDATRDAKQQKPSTTDLGRKPLPTPPFKWTNSTQVQDQHCKICNLKHLQQNNPCKFADPVKYKGLANHEGCCWKESKIGKEWAALGYYNAMEHPPNWHKERIAEGKILPDYSPTGEIPLNTMPYDEDDIFPIAKLIVNISQERSANKSVTALLDTGAGANFINNTLSKNLKLKLFKLNDENIFKRSNFLICGATSYEKCTSVTHYVRVAISINNITNETYNLLCFVGPFKEDLIIGLRDIRRHNLVLSAPNLFLTYPQTRNMRPSRIRC